MKPWMTIVVAASVIGCGGPQYVRDSEEPSLDEYTMSLRFDRKDIDKLYDENIKALLAAPVAKDWERLDAEGKRPVVAVFPMRNETAEHVEPQLDALLSKIETDLVNKVRVDVVSYENQPDLIAEIKRQHNEGYDPTRMATYGKQLGAQYFVTGKVYDVVERADEERRAQYFMFLQVLDVSTGAIKFQNESKLTKGLIR